MQLIGVWYKNKFKTLAYLSPKTDGRLASENGRQMSTFKKLDSAT